MEKKIGIIGHVDHGKTTLTAAIMTALDKTEKETKIIQEIIDEEKSFKITNPYKDLEIPTMLYASVSEKLSKYGKKKGSNLTPKKKKRKK